MAMHEPARPGDNRTARLDALYDRLDTLNMAPYWATGRREDNDETQQILKARKALPFVWKYKEIEPLLYQAAELITMDDSERRSIVLVNPGLAPVRATVLHKPLLMATQTSRQLDLFETKP
jgi:gentisate 1,2-dioxygenase